MKQPSPDKPAPPLMRCVRVVVGPGCKAVGPVTAKEEFGITPTIVFMRQDGWTLGSPKQYENEAYQLWCDQWRMFQRLGDWMKPIEEYKPERNKDK